MSKAGKAKRANIQIAGIEVEVFQLPDGEYVMSQSQAGNAVKVQGVLVSRFIKEQRNNQGYRSCKNEGVNTSKPDTARVIEITKIPSVNDSNGRGGNNNLINVIPINLASEFWFDQAIKGNVKAQALTHACLEEALKRRCDRAFSKVKDSGISKALDILEEAYENEAKIAYTTWMESRQFLKDAHSNFTNCCLYNGFHPAIAHDKITVAVCGKSAAELRELETIHGTSKIGLNHIPDKEVLTKIAQVKLEFSRQRVGNVPQRIKKALQKLNIESEE